MTLDLDPFVEWLAGATECQSLPCADDSLYEELGIDQFRFLLLVHIFDELTDGDAIPSEDVFDEVKTVRDLYLYYLRVTSMPIS